MDMLSERLVATPDLQTMQAFFRAWAEFKAEVLGPEAIAFLKEAFKDEPEQMKDDIKDFLAGITVLTWESKQNCVTMEYRTWSRPTRA